VWLLHTIKWAGAHRASSLEEPFAGATRGGAGILNAMIEADNDALIELTPKTQSDVKGSILIEYEGRKRLLEVDSSFPFSVSRPLSFLP